MVFWNLSRVGFGAVLIFASTSLGPQLHASDPGVLLTDAAERQDLELAQQLVASGAMIDAHHSDGMTPLHWAVYHDNLELVRLLVDADADVNRSNRYGVPPLSTACKNGHAAIVQLLLDAGADANASLRGGETVLMTASRTGRLDPVQSLLDAGANVDAMDRKGQTALMWAAADGHGKAVDALLAAGADPNHSLDSGFSPLLFAVREGQTDVVMRLVQAGIDLNAAVVPKRGSAKGLQAGTTPLILAIENGHFQLAAALLDAGVDPNDSSCGFHPLHAMTFVRKPLRGDGDPAPVGSGSMTSLEFVRLLIKHGAEVNAIHGKQNGGGDRLSRTGATAFLLAAETGDLPLMRILLQHGADRAIKNVDDCTPLLAAAGVGVLGNGDETAGTEAEAISVIDFLLKRGADINAIDKRGNTAMHGAAYKSWRLLIEFLSQQGIDVTVWNTKNRRGWTPLMIAQGHRPGNFRPSAETIKAVQNAMRSERP